MYHEVTSLRFLNVNLEWQKIKMGRKTYENLFFFSWGYVLNHHHAIGYHSCFYSCCYYNSYTLKLKKIKLTVKACVRCFYQIFIFWPKDSPSKTMKNTFYFIEKTLFVLEIFNFLYFCPSLFFYLSAIALEDDRR